MVGISTLVVPLGNNHYDSTRKSPCALEHSAFSRGCSCYADRILSRFPANDAFHYRVIALRQSSSNTALLAATWRRYLQVHLGRESFSSRTSIPTCTARCAKSGPVSRRDLGPRSTQEVFRDLSTAGTVGLRSARIGFAGRDSCQDCLCCSRRAHRWAAMDALRRASCAILPVEPARRLRFCWRRTLRQLVRSRPRAWLARLGERHVHHGNSLDWHGGCRKVDCLTHFSLGDPTFAEGSRAEGWLAKRASGCRTIPCLVDSGLPMDRRMDMEALPGGFRTVCPQRRADSWNRRLAVGGRPLSECMASYARCSGLDRRNSKDEKLCLVGGVVPLCCADLFPAGARVVFHLARAVRCCQPKHR